MSCDRSSVELLEAWKRGNERAAGYLLKRYQTRLLPLVRVRLSRKFARRIDPEDVLQSAWRSFFSRVRSNRLEPQDDDGVWRLLVTLSLRKLYRQVHRHTAQQRSVDLEQQELTAWLGQRPSTGPTAQQIAMLMEEIRLLSQTLDSTACEVLKRSLQGQDVPLIARETGFQERSVRRALERIQRSLPHREANWPGLASLIIPERSGVLAVEESIPEATASYDQYHLKEMIGSGGFSKVYRAVERSTGDNVAVKFLKKGCWKDQRAQVAFIREFAMLRELHHPGILKVRRWGTTPGGALFLVTELIDGLNLGQWRQKHGCDLQAMLAKVRDIAAAVCATHERGILHGDLTPSNIMICHSGRTVLCDFGMARHAEVSEDVPRGGTVGFLAPEQISGEFGPMTVQSDVYGLGALLYALVSGRPPFTGHHEADILSQMLSSPPPELTIPNCPEFSFRLNRIVMRCLTVQPADRWQTAAEFARRLAEVQEFLKSNPESI